MLRLCIHTGDHPPIKQQPYRMPVVRRENVSQLIDDMEAQGVVQPSVSQWASPIVLKDGNLRFCVDYRRLNVVTTKERFFSTLDLTSGYWQLKLDARSKSAFTTFEGYEFVRMPFGLCNAPATFQRLMQQVLTGLERKSCFVYMDDILVASKTFAEHLHHLREVFTGLRASRLCLKPRKCQLLHENVPFLGYVVSKEGITPDLNKIEKVRNYPHPVDVTSVRCFLGLASYY